MATTVWRSPYFTAILIWVKHVLPKLISFILRHLCVSCVLFLFAMVRVDPVAQLAHHRRSGLVQQWGPGGGFEGSSGRHSLVLWWGDNEGLFRRGI